MDEEIDPSAIGKYPEIIKKAQKEMSQSDVLVCGLCHTVFHFIELFKEHKSKGCSKESTFNDIIRRETKPKVWAFLLWKASRLNMDEKDSPTANSWKLYQTWVKLDESVRDTWILAGKTIQSFAKLGQGTLQEMPVRITKTVYDKPNEETKNIVKKPAEVRTPPAKPLLLAPKAVVKDDTKQYVNIKTEPQNSIEPLKTNDDLKSQNQTTQKPSTVPTPQVTLTKIAPKQISRLAIRTKPNSNTDQNQLELIEECTIEKILAKRYNPPHKVYEYLIKWENRSHDQNTWEPHTHLDSCPQLLENFEKQLTKQKLQRAALAAKQEQLKNQPNATAAATALTTTTTTATATINQNSIQNIGASSLTQSKTTGSNFPSINVSSTNLPNSSLMSSIRTGRISKARAMDQVKQWCENNEAANVVDNINSNKRKFDDESDYETDESITMAFPGNKKQKLLTNNNSNNSTLPSLVMSSSATSTPVNHSNRIGSSSVRIVHVNSKTPPSAGISPTVPTTATNNITPIQLPKLNGTTANIRLISSPTGSSADVVIKTEKDGQKTGIIKKPGVTVSLSPKSQGNVRVLTKNDTTTSGVVRITSNTQLMQSPVSPAINTGTRPVQIRPYVPPRSVASTTTPTTITRHTTTITQRPIRPSLVPPTTGSAQITKIIIPRPNIKQSPLSSSISPNNTSLETRATITRVLKSSPTIKQTTPEQKIAALAKYGDLKITRKSSTPTLQQQQQQQQRQQQQQHILSSPDDEYNLNDPFRETYQSPNAVRAYVESPPRELTLCPITGKVLGRAEGEKTPELEIPDIKLENLNNTDIIDVQQQQQHQQQQQQQNQIHQQKPQLPHQSEPTLINDDGTIQNLLTNEDGSPILVSGEDGTIYQVAGKNEQGQTILISHSADGQQQCVYLAGDDDENPLEDTNAANVDGNNGDNGHNITISADGGGGGGGEDDETNLNMEINSSGQQQQQQQQQQQLQMQEEEEQQQLQLQQQQQQQQQQHVSQENYNTSTTKDVHEFTNSMDANGATTVVTSSQPTITTLKESHPITISTDDSQEGQITAEVIQTDLPSPGGTRRVILLLPDGSFMMTEVNDEQYQSLNLVN